MFRHFYIVILTSALILASSFAPTASARIFTGAEGKTIDAELIAMHGNQVTIRRNDNRKQFTLPLSKFSVKDRTYILNQKKAGLLKTTSYDTSNQPDVAPVTKVQHHFSASQKIDELLANHWQTQGVSPAL